tara:strand:- start:46 stop:564 length:519 start_codon:yes stop_codon:yes gene_type:complete
MKNILDLFKSKANTGHGVLVDHPPSGYVVGMDEIAITDTYISSAGFFTCCGVAIAQNGIGLYSHVTSFTSSEKLAAAIKATFNLNESMRIHVINTDLRHMDEVDKREPILGDYAVKKLKKALEKSGLIGRKIEEHRHITMMDKIDFFPHCGGSIINDSEMARQSNMLRTDFF